MNSKPTRSYTWLAAAIIIAAVLVSATLYATLGPAETTVTNASTSTSTATTTVTTFSAVYQPCTTQAYGEPSTSSLSSHVPVLLMSPGTTAEVCVVYQASWVFNDNPDTFGNGSYTFYPFIVAKYPGCSGPTGGTACEQTIYRGFNIRASPSSVQMSPSTDYVTVVYTITAPSNSTGFYDQSAPWWGVCATMPMAVGYSAAQVNSSDFGEPPLHSCLAEPFVAVAEYVTNMNVTYVSLPPE